MPCTLSKHHAAGGKPPLRVWAAVAVSPLTAQCRRAAAVWEPIALLWCTSGGGLGSTCRASSVLWGTRGSRARGSPGSRGERHGIACPGNMGLTGISQGVSTIRVLVREF